MRKFIFIFLVNALIFSACKGGKDLSQNGCKKLIQMEQEAFNNLSTETYFLDKVSQNGKEINIQISTKIINPEVAIYWNGNVRQTYPAQASVKIIVNGEAGETSEVKDYCFNILDMKKHGSPLKLYFLDDEETLDLNFE